MKQKKSESGFTLLEVMIAVGILVGAILVVSNTWSGNFLRVRKANLYNNAAVLLEQKVIELKSKYREKSMGEIPETEAGDFGTENKNYRWTFKSQVFKMPDLSSVLIKEGQGDQNFLTMIKQTQDFISQAVKEATISVFVKTAGREVEFSVTTYFVDFNQQFGGGGTPGGSGP